METAVAKDIDLVGVGSLKKTQLKAKRERKGNMDKDKNNWIICCGNCSDYEEGILFCHLKKVKKNEMDKCMSFIHWKDKKREWQK
ncbi:hypothetical protein LCGC14_1735850 [marine sediment metagenome]|uniref:Uncharacterized protein n=1 Tax=marine sediment metagenome TaxID=412755 RepID=A0A0F9K7X0_9ZZZZ